MFEGVLQLPTAPQYLRKQSVPLPIPEPDPGYGPENDKDHPQAAKIDQGLATTN